MVQVVKAGFPRFGLSIHRSVERACYIFCNNSFVLQFAFLDDISFLIPADMEVIYCMTNTYTEEKTAHGVVSEVDGLGTFEVVFVDFLAASCLNTIGD